MLKTYEPYTLSGLEDGSFAQLLVSYSERGEVFHRWGNVTVGK